MKLILRVFFFFVLSTKLSAQTTTAADKVIYLDSTWAETTTDNYQYIRIIKEYYAANKKTYTIKEYYKSKTIKLIGASSDRDVIKQEGPFVTYYENGNKKLTVTYVNKNKTGKEYNWYENGTLKSELEYFADKKGVVAFKVLNYWSPQKQQTVIDGNGSVEDKIKNLERSGAIKNGQPEGIWQGKNSIHKYSFTEHYEKGKLKSGISIDSLKTEHSYKVILEKPLPKNGLNSFYANISKNMKIPVELQNKVFGKIYLTFVIDAQGNLIEPKVVKGIGYGLDESAIAAVTAAGKWIPGLERGIPVRVLYSLPITIAKNRQ